MIGYTKKSLKDFVIRLKGAQVDCVVDIRLNNTSQLAGFSKRDDLEFLLEEGFGTSYIHIPEFAPTEELLQTYKSQKNWPDYETGYHALMDEREMAQAFLELVDRNGWKRPCLLCSEDTSDHCHRRLLAEAIQRAYGNVEVRHL